MTWADMTAWGLFAFDALVILALVRVIVRYWRGAGDE